MIKVKCYEMKKNEQRPVENVFHIMAKGISSIKIKLNQQH